MHETINAPSASTWVDLFVTGPLKARFRKGKNREKISVAAGAGSGAARAGLAAHPKTRESSIFHRAASPSAPTQVKSRPGGEPRANPTRADTDVTSGVDVARQARRSLRISTHPSKVPSQTSGNALTRSSAIGAQNEIPELTERLAEAVAARVQGLPGGKGHEKADKMADKRAAEYVDELATWQAARADSALARLITALDGSSGVSPGGGKSSHDPIRLATEASKAWLLSSCLNGDGPPIGTQALDSAIDRHLEALTPRALVALHRRALEMERAATTVHQEGVWQLYLGMVGMPAARRVWAARQVCDLVGKPMSFDQTRDLLRVTSANDPAAVSNSTALLEVASHLNGLMMARYLPTLTQRLRERARAALDAKNIGVNALADIAKRHRESTLYASMVADGLRGTLTQTPAHADHTQPLRHLTDTQIRERLDAALDELSAEEIAAAKTSLLPRGGATAQYTRYLKRLVELCGAGPAEQASLGRQFTILCEALARRTGGASNAPTLQALRGWDWDVRLTRHDRPASQPGRLARLGSTVYSLLRRAVVSLFDPYEAALYRARDARTGLERAASDFMKTVCRNATRDATEELRKAERHIRMATVPRKAGKSSLPVPDASLRAYNEGESRLMKAANRYQAACEKLGADGCKFLGLATNPAQFYEAAFRTALSRMPGARVDALGRAYFAREWKDNLLRRQRIYRALTPTRTPRTRSGMASIFARSTSGGAQQSEPLQSKSLLGCVETVLREEPAIRAAAEVVRTLGNHVRTQAVTTTPTPTPTPTPTATATVTLTATTSAPATGTTVETPASGAQRKVRPLDDAWALEQRFRPLEHQHGFTVDWSREYFVRAGMQRLRADERARLGSVIGNLDWRPPAWLQNDELWLAVVRYYQGMSPQRTDA